MVTASNSARSGAGVIRKPFCDPLPMLQDWNWARLSPVCRARRPAFRLRASPWHCVRDGGLCSQMLHMLLWARDSRRAGTMLAKFSVTALVVIGWAGGAAAQDN